jgi:hypothetical protein
VAAIAPGDVVADKLLRSALIGIADSPATAIFILDRYICNLESDVAVHPVDEFPQQIGDKLLLSTKPALTAIVAGGLENAACRRS